MQNCASRFSVLSTTSRMTEQPTILVVDDEQSIRESFKLILSDKYNIITAASGEAAAKYSADSKIDLIFLDIRMPGMDGLETLKKIKEIIPDQLIVMITAVNDVQKASEAIKMGAYDYVVKPFDVENILKITSNLLFKKSMLEEGRKVGLGIGEPAIIGTSERIEAVRRLVKEASGKKGGVLILGPEGVEREAAARSIAPSVVYDARSSYQTLFGKSGGGTVADLKKVPGALDFAEGGAVFINHVELLPEWAQEKLLQSKVRLFFGTSKNLKEIGFNQTLYEKASETVIELPPLSERSSDIPMILEYYLNEANKKYFRKVKGFTPETQNLLSSYPWPGNVSQLAAVVSNLVLFNDKLLIEPEDLPLNILINEASFYPMPLEDMYSQFEKKHIKDVLAAVGSDREKATKILGVSLSVLENKL